jgi:hypothetical protein
MVAAPNTSSPAQRSRSCGIMAVVTRRKRPSSEDVKCAGEVDSEDGAQGYAQHEDRPHLI